MLFRGGGILDAIVSLYTTTTGRISRKQWWLGVLGLFLASIVLSLVMSVIGFGAWAGVPAIDPNNPDMAALSAEVADSIRRSAWASLVMYAIMAYPSYCLSVKRRHDRDNAGVDVLVFMAVNGVVLLLQALGVGVTMVDMGNGLTMPTPSMWLGTVSLLIAIGGIYLLVVLGFLRGTDGANSYGADPVTGAAATA